MNKLMSTAALLALTSTGALAGGIERAAPSTGLLFEDGEYAEFTFSTVSPTVSGSTGGGAASSGDITPSYQNWSFGYKRDLNDSLALAVSVGQPWGADVSYPTGTGYPLAGSTAQLNTLSVDALLRYKMQNNFSVHGGVRLQSMNGDISLSSGYNLSVSDEWDIGYILGVAYERPDIALRVALTYYSEIGHGFTDNAGGPFGTADPFEVATPQSLNLEFQSGIAQNTLLFGSIRWADWTATKIAPDVGTPLPDPLVDYDDDTVTYNLGIGRRFNETWSGAVTIGYEASSGGFSGNLGPTDGNKSLGLGVTYTHDNYKISGGVRYIWIGDAQTEAPGGGLLGTFTDNHAVAAGIKMSVSF